VRAKLGGSTSDLLSSQHKVGEIPRENSPRQKNNATIRFVKTKDVQSLDKDKAYSKVIE
jgi:hypothetical protein